MTVSSTTTKNSYSGDGSTTEFAYGFKIFDDDDITVIIRTDATGAEATKTKTTHYTVSGVGSASGGNVTFTSGNVPTSAQTVVLIRNTARTQLTDYVANDPFPAESHEDALDKLTLITQELEEEIGRSLKVSQTNVIATSEFTDDATARANKILGFDGSGNLQVTEGKVDTITSSVSAVSAGGTPTASATYTASSGALALAFGLVTGNTGATGSTGSSGAAGSNAGLALTFSNSTSDADPGGGKLAFNNGTISSASVIFIDDNDDNGVDISTFVQSWDDVSNSTARGIILVTKEGTASTYAMFKVTGAVTNASGYSKVAVTHVVSNGTFSNEDGITVQFSYSGADSGLTFGISDTNAVKIDSSSVADDEYARFTANGLESRATSEVLSDIGGQASLTFGISNTNAVKIDSASVADDEYARFTANGLESRATSEVLSDIAAAPAAGSSNIVTTGALNSGSITSGFGAIDNGASAITTTGAVSGGSFVVSDDGDIGSASATDAIQISSAGIVTFKDDILIKDAGTIGSASDPDALAIASDGKVTASQTVAIAGHASIGVDAVASTRALTVAGSTDGTGSNILVCYNSSLTPKFSVRDDGFVSAAYNLQVIGSVSKGSGSFKIDHPLPSKKDTHDLVHSFIEGPQADLIYRGRATLASGTVDVNIDTAAGMTEGTFVLLCTDVQCFTSNEEGWAALKGAVSGNVLTITAQDDTCTDTVSWMVIGERKDTHMLDTEWTDENGKVIVEPTKVT